ncbi:MAG: pyridoxal-dependent decarboxylase [Candidatus Pacearchaeota archaeon]
MDKKYFNKKLIKRMFGDAGSLNVSEIKNQLNELDKIFSKNFKKNSPRVFSYNKEKPSLIEEDPKDLMDTFSGLQYYFDHCLNWRSVRTQFNVTPPPSLISISSQVLVDMVNPTLATEIGCGNLLQLEKEITRFISHLVGWNDKESIGIFTFGGTGTNLYGMKIGLNKSQPSISLEGVKDVVFIDNDQTHSCHRTACDWLGVGINNDIILKTYDGIINPNELEEAMVNVIKKNKKIGCIILNGGESYDYSVDPIYDVYKVREKVCKKFDLNYKPHIHVDSVSGWVFLMFNNYDFSKNPLSFSKESLNKIKAMNSKIKQLKYADSFGVDFHKTGFTQYISSLFMLKNKRDIQFIAEGSRGATAQSFEISGYSPGQYTLETSRSAIGPVSAYVTLSSLGIKGFQYLIGNFMDVAEDLRSRLRKDKTFILCNGQALGWCTLFIINLFNKKLSFQEVLSYDQSKQDKINNYQKEFYKYLNEGKNKNKWVFSLSGRYKIRAFKLYPMSPYTSKKNNDEILNWIKQNKKEFDKRYYDTARNKQIFE